MIYIYRTPFKEFIKYDSGPYYAGKYYLLNRKLHRNGDKPAIERANGDKWWYQNGLKHRDNDKPAIEYENGDKWWYQYGSQHRANDKPAIEYAIGHKQWYKNGVLHRDDDKPAIECINGDKIYYKDGRKQAIERTGTGKKEWYTDYLVTIAIEELAKKKGKLII